MSEDLIRERKKPQTYHICTSESARGNGELSARLTERVQAEKLRDTGNRSRSELVDERQSWRVEKAGQNSDGERSSCAYTSSGEQARRRPWRTRSGGEGRRRAGEIDFPVQLELFPPEKQGASIGPRAASMTARAVADSVAVVTGSLRLLARAREVKSSRAQKMHFSPPTPSPVPPPSPVPTDRPSEPIRPLIPAELDSRTLSPPIPESVAAPSILEHIPPPIATPPPTIEFITPVEPPPPVSAKSEVATAVEPVIAPLETLAATQLELGADTPEASVPAELPPRPVRVSRCLLHAVLIRSLQNPRLMKASTVPASRLGRLFHYGGKDRLRSLQRSR